MEHPIPVSLLTGFLGAGKTTLLNHLLNDASAGRIAVVVNEFGEAGLDHDLIETSAEDVVLMPAGCICCSVRGDLTKTMMSLLARRMRDELEFDRVVIETTGLADPGPIHHTFIVDPVLGPNFAIDGTITVVDGVLGRATLDEHGEAQSQVAMADRIVITKQDLAEPAALIALEERLDRLNAAAPRIRADKGAVPTGALFGIGLGQKSMATDKALDWLGTPAAPADPLAGLSGFKQPGRAAIDMPAPSHHASDDRIVTASVILDQPIPAAVFDHWLDNLLGARGADVLRAKGIVHIEGMPQPFVFHGVQHIFEAPVPLKEWPEGDLTSRVVIIARDIPREELITSLELLRLRDAPEKKRTELIHTEEDLPF